MYRALLRKPLAPGIALAAVAAAQPDVELIQPARR